MRIYNAVSGNRTDILFTTLWQFKSIKSSHWGGGRGLEGSVGDREIRKIPFIKAAIAGQEPVSMSSSMGSD